MRHKNLIRAAFGSAITTFTLLLGLTACTIVLSQEVEGTSAGSGGVLDPMLAIFEEELNASYDASRALGAASSRGLAGGANSIKHGLPATTVAKVRESVRATIVASGLEKSRDLEKVAPAIAEATAAALQDPAVVGDTPLAEEELVQVNAVSSRAVAKSLNVQGVTAQAEGLGTEAERQARLEALARAASANVDSMGISTTNFADALQKLVLVVVDSGNADVSATGTGADAPETLLSDRAGSIVRIAAARLDGKLTGSACSTALNDLANAAVVGLGSTAIASASVDATGAKLQAVVQDGVLASLFLAYYQFANDAGLSSSALRGAITFSDAMTVLGTGAFYDSVATNVQAVKDSILIPAADSKARKATIIDTANPPANELANATAAASIASGANKTWTEGSWIISQSVQVDGNLTIAPGAVLYLKSGVNITIGSTGSIHAVGTAASPIWFTRAVEGSAWGSIRIYSNSSLNILEYCDISGGNIGVDVASSSDPGIAKIDHCTFRINADHGIEGTDAKTDLGRMTTVRDCCFFDNGSYPVVINENMDLDGSNRFYDPLSRSSPDPAAKSNAISFAGNINSQATFAVTEVPYWMNWTGTYSIGQMATASSLTLGPGVMLKFGTAVWIRVYAGSSFTAVGTPEAPVVFTSVADDRLGDTNGSTIAATAGDWGGIDIMSSANTFTNCEFAYASTSLAFNYYDTSQPGAATVSGCDFHHASAYGMGGTRAYPTTVTGSYFWSNSSWPVVVNQNITLDETNHFHARTATTVDPATKYNAIVFSGYINRSVEFKVTEVPYHIAGNLWIGNLTMASILTIQPGAMLKFAPSVWIRVYAGSFLSAEGTSQAPIVFTSYNDDRLGDTNGSPAPVSPGDWGGIDVMSSTNTFTNCEFAYASTSLAFNYYDTSQPGAATVSGCGFHHASAYGMDGTRAYPSTITGSYFWSNSSWPIVINQNIALDETNHFHDRIAVATDPSVPSNAVAFSGYINRPIEFKVTEVPYRMATNLWIGNSTAGSVLTISPGAVLKFALGTAMRVYYGSSIVVTGTVAAPVTFTSLNDDLLGDTNGIAGDPSPGSWNGIDLMSLAASCIFDHCVFSYATTPIYFNAYDTSEQGAGLISNSVFTHNSVGGISALRARSGTVITANTFSDNNANGTTIWDIDYNGKTAEVTQSGNTNPAGPGGAAFTRPQP